MTSLSMEEPNIQNLRGVTSLAEVDETSSEQTPGKYMEYTKVKALPSII